MVAVAYERFNCNDLICKIFVIWTSGYLREVVAQGGSAVIITIMMVIIVMMVLLSEDDSNKNIIMRMMIIGIVIMIKIITVMTVTMVSVFIVPLKQPKTLIWKVSAFSGISHAGKSFTWLGLC